MKKTAILITGMHRSGTSALARTVNLLGARLPTELLAAQEDNPNGFWESLPLLLLNDRALKMGGVDWKDSGNYNHQWLYSPEGEKLISEMSDCFCAQYPKQDLIVMKDPRLSRLLPLWKIILARLGIDPIVFISIRNPWEVAQSMKIREGLQPENEFSLWTTYMLDAERYSRGMRRNFIYFDDLLNDWKKTIEVCTLEHEITWPRSFEKAQNEIETFLSTDQKHFSAQPNVKIPYPVAKETFEAITQSPTIDYQQLDALFEKRNRLHIPETDATSQIGSNNELSLLSKTNFSLINHAHNIRIKGHWRTDGSHQEKRLWVKVGKRIVEGNLIKGDSPNNEYTFEITFNIGSGWKTITLWTQIGNEKPHCHLRHIGYYSNTLRFTEKKAQRSTVNKTIAFISDSTGDTYRYRCQYQVEKLRLMGHRVKLYPPRYVDYQELLETAHHVILHRVPWNASLNQFAEEAQKRGIRLTFDTDDLIFRPQFLNDIDAYKRMPHAEQISYRDSLTQFRKAMALCDQISVSTEELAKQAREEFPKTPISWIPNRIGFEVLSWAEEAQRQESLSKSRHTTNITLSYFSGSQTHESDFAQCAPALAQILNDSPQIKLALIGYIEIPQTLAAYRDRIEKIPFMPQKELPHHYLNTDINLAPLELDNTFTACKSALKYFEAALLKVPTVASNWGDYKRAITHEQNGFLCTTTEDWHASLTSLIKNDTLRKTLGQNAYQDIRTHYMAGNDADFAQRENSHYTLT